MSNHDEISQLRTPQRQTGNRLQQTPANLPQQRTQTKLVITPKAIFWSISASIALTVLFNVLF